MSTLREAADHVAAVIDSTFHERGKMPNCKTCGHAAGAHTNGKCVYDVPQGGLVLDYYCACKEYVNPETYDPAEHGRGRHHAHISLTWNRRST